jgi:ribosomal protein L29
MGTFGVGRLAFSLPCALLLGINGTMPAIPERGIRAMNKQQLHEKLEQLHTELNRVESSDSNQREILQKVATDIQELLVQPGDTTDHYQGFGERLKEAVAQLEASHPEATLRIRQVIDELAYMGI